MLGRRVAFVVSILVPLSFSTAAAVDHQARVTEIVRNVQVLASQTSPRPARLNELVRNGSMVRTGADSRAELTSADLSITRVGANSLLTFEDDGHALNVQNGAVLLYLPQNSGKARIYGDVLTAGITGTTVMFESQPRRYNKLIVLEGSCHARLTSNSDRSVVVQGGQMVVVSAGARQLPQPVDIDLERVTQTATLITKFRPLPSRPIILAAIDNQKQAGVPLANPMLGDTTGLNARDVVASLRQPSPHPHQPPNR